jgi:hypothetical protein
MPALHYYKIRALSGLTTSASAAIQPELLEDEGKKDAWSS